MTGRAPLGIAAGFVLALAATAATLALGAASTGTAQPQGVRWARLSIDDALARAASAHQRVLVEFNAGWCTYCKTLEDEVLSQRAGGELTADMIAVQLDFDAPANREMVERYVVLGLPTVLVLTPDGTQVGRIMGYESRQDWLHRARAAKTATDPVPALRTAAAERPRDAARALALGEALLVRGHADEGEAFLERVTFLGDDAAAANALFVLGRYHHRVRRDPRTSRHLWRELGARYPRSDYAPGAWIWYAKAEAELGQPELGLLALRTWAEADPESTTAREAIAEFAAEHHLPIEPVAATP